MNYISEILNLFLRFTNIKNYIHRNCFFCLFNQLSSILDLRNFYLLLIDNEEGSDNMNTLEFFTAHDQHTLTNAVISLKVIIIICNKFHFILFIERSFKSSEIFIITLVC
jgi:hypothetical protein